MAAPLASRWLPPTAGNLGEIGANQQGGEREPTKNRTEEVRDRALSSAEKKKKFGACDSLGQRVLHAAYRLAI